jgi:hypothetical protein
MEEGRGEGRGGGERGERKEVSAQKIKIPYFRQSLP